MVRQKYKHAILEQLCLYPRLPNTYLFFTFVFV